MSNTQAIEALQKIESPEESFGSIVERAIDKGVPVETMERLLAMYEKLQARQAKAEFDRALAGFQAECPTIQKTKKVMNKDGKTVRYQYAPLENIVQQVKGLLEKHGFSYTVDAVVEPGIVHATCKATHHRGHSQTSSFAVPVDKESYMNPAQQVASALTFAKRYAYCNAFGILTGDEDDDSHASVKDVENAPERAKDAGKAKPIQPANAAGRPNSGPKRGTPAPQATEKHKTRFLTLLRPLGQLATQYGWAKGWLFPPADDFPGEPLESMSLNHVPATKQQFDAVMADIQTWIDSNTPKGNEDGGKGAREPKGTPGDAAADKQPSASAPHDDEWWRDVIVPVPPKGVTKAEYLKDPETIGGLYERRHDDDQSRRRLFGFAEHFEPKGWTKRDGTQMPASEADLKFREALDAFADWFKKNHEEEL